MSGAPPGAAPGAEGKISEELHALLDSRAALENPGRFADVLASALGLPSEQESRVLLALEVVERLRLVYGLLAEAATNAEVKSKIARDVESEFGKVQREAVLRQQLRAIRRELGEEEGEGKQDELRRRLAELELVDRELRRLDSMGPGQPEAQVVRSYLELIADLPWNRRAKVSEDLEAVARQLDEDHFGLSEVKQRILEHLAVRKVTGNPRGAILSLVGPPGVGKTSLGQSIASASGRPLVRVALGGIRDEAEIRGHRRTYVGALPGRILAAIRRAGVKNPGGARDPDGRPDRARPAGRRGGGGGPDGRAGGGGPGLLKARAPRGEACGSALWSTPAWVKRGRVIPRGDCPGLPARRAA